MAVNTDNFKSVVGATGESFAKFGFELLPDENTGDFYTAENEISGIFSGERGTLKLRYADEKIELLFADSPEELESAAKRFVVSLLPSEGDERDIKFIANEISDTLESKFSKKAPAKKSVQKAQQTVSKTAVKNGSFYDPNTLASKLCLVFPELRTAYKENIAAYGEFLCEDFFVNYGTKAVIDAIKENRPQTMKKLFQTLNEIYEDGTNDTQSLIAVTILGELGNDQILLARCVDYMSETMAPPVIEVNKFLATRAGKKAKEKMKNPPAYKPKKKKKPGMFSQLMSGGAGMTPPTV